MFANIWNWILSIVGSAFLLWQVIIVIALVVSGIACIIYVIWKLILYVAEKSGGLTLHKKIKNMHFVKVKNIGIILLIQNLNLNGIER